MGYNPNGTIGDRGDSILSGRIANSQTSQYIVQGVYNARTGDITRGKRKGIKYIIKVL